MATVSCIYIIKSILKEKRVYVGSAINFIKRKNQHLGSLRRGNHHSIKLQNHVNKYGLDDLTIEVLELCEKPALIGREQHYIDLFSPYFNISKTAGSCLGLKHSAETKKKISEVHKGKRYGSETRQKMSAAKKGKTGRKHSIESLQKMSESAKSRRGVSPSSETRRKISVARKGIKRSAETVAKMRLHKHNAETIAKMKGRRIGDAHKDKLKNINSKPVKCVETGIVFPSISEAARELSFHLAAISKVCLGKQHTTGGLTFRYA